MKRIIISAIGTSCFCLSLIIAAAETSARSSQENVIRDLIYQGHLLKDLGNIEVASLAQTSRLFAQLITKELQQRLFKRQLMGYFELKLSFMNIAILHPNVFKAAEFIMVEILDLSNNNLLILPSNCFVGLDSLEIMFLDNNPLLELQANAFAGIPRLSKLYLRNNPGLPEELPSHEFLGLPDKTKIVKCAFAPKLKRKRPIERLYEIPSTVPFDADLL